MKTHLKKTAERPAVGPFKHEAQNIAVNIVEAERAGPKDLMRINKLRVTVLDTVHFSKTGLVINVIEHDPPDRRKKELHARQRALKMRLKVKIVNRFVMKDENKKDDEDTDPGIS